MKLVNFQSENLVVDYISQLNFLVSSYLRKDCLDSFVQKKQFFKLIQLLSLSEVWSIQNNL
jgi:hypothetical protein